ncbi:polysaccharide deacetylase family protein [Chachezhania antarctica]|uniref:polysaccharide deacetylase family protein n=1 Tax=Chachezhania antarctica TaxID=2340860 RepID=UPI000EAB70D8|nr:polysaccharide deacetylase family protein [Chachezhania antarctica]
MTGADWTQLEAELARWTDAGLSLPVWWRDDDAVTVTPALERMTNLAEVHGLPVHLAVIPDGAEPALADYVRGTDWLLPAVHGWAHANHASKSEKKAEFGASRPLMDRLTDAQNGLSRSRELFGADLQPLFVPPWNRMGADLAPALAAVGYRAVSGFTPRDAKWAAPGLERINTHVDPVAWKTTRALADPEVLLAGLVAHLADRREGRADRAEPLGLLTHHLIHDDDVWEFVTELLTRLQAGPGRVWRIDRNLNGRAVDEPA